MKSLSDLTVIIPALNPGEGLLRLVDALAENGIRDVLVVNDGSCTDCAPVFDALKARPCCTVLRHQENRGKGAALKTAFAYYLDRRAACPPDTEGGVVTADADGQHTPDDIIACGRAMLSSKKVVLGARDFSLPEIPRRSVVGNRITAFVFRYGNGINITDTQTGLRAIPARFLPALSRARGDRFEYETNMLLDLKRYGIPYMEIPIDTVYLEGNRSSHFHPLRDSLQIYRQIIGYMLSSAASFLIDNGLFWLLTLLLSGHVSERARIFLCFSVARLLSSVCNYLQNKRLVFAYRGDNRKTLLKYYVLCIPQMLLSAWLVYLFSDLLSQESSFILTLIKIIVDSILFIGSYLIQTHWVFRRKENTPSHDA